MRTRALAFAAALSLAAPLAAEEKPAAPPPPAWTGSLGAGLALNSGNTNTSSYTLTFEVKHDPKKNVFKAAGLYLRTSTDLVIVDSAGNRNTVSQTTADKATLLFRDEYSFTDRFFVYGEVGYLRDKIAEIDYLVSPTAGAGYKVVKTDAITLDLSGGFGGAFQRNTGQESTSSGAFRASQAFTWQISKSSKLTQNLSGLWKTDDTSDAVYHFDVALSTSISKLFELKVAYLLDYKNKPAKPELEKDDSAFIAALVMKF